MLGFELRQSSNVARNRTRVTVHRKIGFSQPIPASQGRFAGRLILLATYFLFAIPLGLEIVSRSDNAGRSLSTKAPGARNPDGSLRQAWIMVGLVNAANSNTAASSFGE